MSVWYHVERDLIMVEDKGGIQYRDHNDWPMKPYVDFYHRNKNNWVYIGEFD